MKSNIVEQYYNNGKLERRYHVNQFKQKHGTYQEWFSNGQLWEHFEFVNGKLHGVFQIWHLNGQLIHYDWYDNGLRVVEVFMLRSPIKIYIHQAYVNIESSAFLAHVISDLDSKGIEYEIKYVN
jgi:antitoxin component YwqK of YwqJK toxin-antitoxin module